MAVLIPLRGGHDMSGREREWVDLEKTYQPPAPEREDNGGASYQPLAPAETGRDRPPPPPPDED
jgi:hypothetical protein